jgi:hypothetical protein
MKPELKLLLNLENWQEIYSTRSMEKLQDDVKSLHEKISMTFGKDVINIFTLRDKIIKNSKVLNLTKKDKIAKSIKLRLKDIWNMYINFMTLLMKIRGLVSI